MTTNNAHSNLNQITAAAGITGSTPNAKRARSVLILLAVTVALTTTRFGIVIPIFSKRLVELGAGVEGLGLMALSYALAAFVAAPLAGGLADRFGRRPIILAALAAFVGVNVGYVFAESGGTFVVLRAIQGAMIGSLMPATLGVVADIAPSTAKARWTGILMGGVSSGLVFGPVVGGVLYETLGFEAPFVASASAGLVSLVAAAFFVSETRTRAFRKRETLRMRHAKQQQEQVGRPVGSSMPRPLIVFAALLFLNFMLEFVYGFANLQMVYYVYDRLEWTSIQFGDLVAAYGVAMVSGQVLLGQVSDRYGRTPVIILGLTMTSTLYAGLALFTSFPMLVGAALITGAGEALAAPAPSALYLDITPERHLSRVMGIRESSIQLGGVAGPLLLIVAARWITPHVAFVAAAVLLAVLAMPALATLRRRSDVVVTARAGVEDRHVAAHGALRGTVAWARAVRPEYVSVAA